VERITLPNGLGELRFYHKTGLLAAACAEHAYDDCRRSSTTRPKARGSGRPIGHLVAWLQQQCNYDSQTTHVHTCRPSHSQRVAARTFFSSLPEAATWFAFEKAKAPGAPDEPVQL